MSKKILFFSTLIVIILLSIYLLFFHNMISSDFATDVYIRVVDDERNVSVKKITDQDTIAELQGIFRGRANLDSPSCGFSDNISIVMQSVDREILFSPALDGCFLVRVSGTNRFILITEEQRDFLNRLFEEHDIFFPHH